MNFSKSLVKEENKDKIALEKELKTLAKAYLIFKQISTISNVNKNFKIYTERVNGIRIRSKCNWYENGEKSIKFFLNIEKYRATQDWLDTIIVNKKELSDSQ